MIRYLLIFIAGIFLATTAYGQNYNRAMFNFLYHKQKPYYFGISLGLNNNNFLLDRSSYFVESDSIVIAEPAKGLGMHVQMVVNLRINHNFDFRLLPGFSFANRRISYTSSNNYIEPTYKRIESVLVEAPFLIRYKSEPYKDMRLFALTGVKYTYDVNSNSRARNNQLLVKISPHDFQFELGTGVQFFFPYFVFSPEIKVSTGIGNVLLYDQKLEESKVLEKVLTHVFTISFHFEG